MSNDQPTRFWNRRFSGWPLAIGTIAVIFLIYGWIYWGDNADDLLWGVRHHHVARLEGHEMRLPFVWRQTEQPAGTHTFDIETSFTHKAFVDSVLISRRDSSSTVAEHMAHAREMTYKLQGVTPELTLPWQSDASLTSHYSCMIMPTAFKEQIRVMCYSNSSNWSLMYNGDKARLDDVETILRNLMAWEQPTK